MKCAKCGAEVKEGLAACSVCFAPLTGEEAERAARAAKEVPLPTVKPRETAPASTVSSGRKGGIFAVALVLILLIGVGAVGWYYFIYLRSPKHGAVDFLEALKAEDYNKLYEACVWTGPIASVQSGQDVKRMFDMARQLLGREIVIKIDSYTIKDVSIQENSATVKTEVVRQGRNSDFDVMMLKTEDGKWKCDIVSTIMTAIGGSMGLPGMPGSPFGR